MVQAWHTFKKFSLPSPNPLHCKQGWHVPRNRCLCFWELPSTPTNSIVKDYSLPFRGKTLFKGMLCYPSSYEILTDCFLWMEFAAYCHFSEDGTAIFCKDKNDRMTPQMKQNKAETIQDCGFPSYMLALLLTGVWGLESEPQRVLCTATGLMQGWTKTGNRIYCMFLSQALEDILRIPWRLALMPRKRNYTK